MTPDQIIGHLIRDARRRKGIRQHQLAAAAGMQQNTVHQWEAGKRPISLDTLVRVAAALGVSPETLMPTQRDIMLTKAAAALAVREGGPDQTPSDENKISEGDKMR